MRRLTKAGKRITGEVVFDAEDEYGLLEAAWSLVAHHPRGSKCPSMKVLGPKYSTCNCCWGSIPSYLGTCTISAPTSANGSEQQSILFWLSSGWLLRR